MKDTELLEDIAEFLDNYSDVVDGSYGEPAPNEAMKLLQKVMEEISRSSRENEAK